MGYFRFYRRLKIAPGITLNFSKSGVSTSLGPRGAKVTLGRHGIRQKVKFKSNISGGHFP